MDVYHWRVTCMWTVGVLHGCISLTCYMHVDRWRVTWMYIIDVLHACGPLACYMDVDHWHVTCNVDHCYATCMGIIGMLYAWGSLACYLLHDQRNISDLDAFRQKLDCVLNAYCTRRLCIRSNKDTASKNDYYDTLWFAAFSVLQRQWCTQTCFDNASVTDLQVSHCIKLFKHGTGALHLFPLTR